MKIFVIGGAGYIGSVCAELLLNEAHEVTIFDNLTEAPGQPNSVETAINTTESAAAD